MSGGVSCNTLVDGTELLATNSTGSQINMDVDLDELIKAHSLDLCHACVDQPLLVYSPIYYLPSRY